MKLPRSLIVILVLQLFFAPPVFAGDFDWLKQLDIKAKADISGFRATLSTRFHVGDVQIKTVLSNVDSPSDAYMVLRLGELSNRSPEYVVKQYQTYKHKGWGALAKRLGIKPGSRAFHALKAGDDLRNTGSHQRESRHGHGHHGNGHGGNGHGRGGGYRP